MKKRILCLLLCVFTLLPLFAACGEKSAEVDITLVENGKAQLYIQLPKDTPAQVLYAKDRLLYYVQEKTGVSLKSGTKEKTDTPTLTIGNAVDDLSTAQSEKLEGDVFRIFAAEQRITVVATNEAFLYDAIDHLIGKMTYDEGTNTLKLTGVLDTTAEGDKTSLRYMFTQGTTIVTSETEQCVLPFLPGADGVLGTADDITGTQGGCRVGNYHYQCIIKNDAASNQMNNITYVVKYDLSTKQTVACSELLDLNHANDITYNEKTGELVIVHNTPRPKMLTFMDPDTLAVTRREELSCEIYSITYNAVRDTYMVGVSGGQRLRPVSADLQNLTSSPYDATPTTSHCTTQGICSDDTFIYCALYDGKNKSSANMQNCITVYDWYGNYVGTINMWLDKKEPENISIVNGEIFVLAHVTGKGGVIYQITPIGPM